ncbi:uncharacterized protein LOC124275429 [Haliotis rubra]|uniref:uncharacterized protein LOC124275429 n=1 Tax=Haliotis rubra TaxID=36100 RepID=UPI001EE52DA2|nr:uncharacterized protein LOC124275429 [Haliotis rubra]
MQGGLTQQPDTNAASPLCRAVSSSSGLVVYISSLLRMGIPLDKDNRNIVYIWLLTTEPFRAGHASLQLGNKKYISWWPKEDKILQRLKPSSGIPRTFVEDVEREDSLPTYAVIIPENHKLNEVAVAQWWDKYKSSGNWDAHHTCCWVVKKALSVGLIDASFTFDMSFSVNDTSNLFDCVMEIPGVEFYRGSHVHYFQLGWKLLKVIESTFGNQFEILQSLLKAFSRVQIISYKYNPDVSISLFACLFTAVCLLWLLNKGVPQTRNFWSAVRMILYTF